MEVHKFFHYCIILPHCWTLSNSEASPRIWTCVTRPSRTHVHKAWAWD